MVRQLDLDMPSCGENLETVPSPETRSFVQEAEAPKTLEKRKVACLVEKQPLFQRFLDHLLTVEGGRRSPKPSKDAQWRVGRLLFEVDESCTNVRLLWTEESMVHIRCTFIEGNSLLAQPRKVGTLRAYLTALLTFYNFILTRASTLATEFDFTDKDRGLVKEFQGRVANWMKSFTTESADRKTEVHQQDFRFLLTSSQMQNLFNSTVHDEFEERFKNLTSPMLEFVNLRDYLIMVLLIQSAQRPGAVCNLTIDEFQAGEWVEMSDHKQYVTLTKLHKTAGQSNLLLIKMLFNVCEG